MLGGNTFDVVMALFTGLISILLAGVSWWMSNLWKTVSRQQDQIIALSLKVAEGYMTKTELQQIFSRIFDALETIQKELRQQ